MTERRKENMIKAIIIPVIIAVIVGTGSSYVAVNVTLAVIENRLQHVEDDLVSIKDVLIEVNKNQIQLAKNGEWQNNTSIRLAAAERHIEILTQSSRDRYTRTEAEKDIQLLMEKIKSHGHIN
jgi:hypothetical protein